MDMIIDNPKLAQVFESFIIVPEFDTFLEFLESGFKLDKKDALGEYDLSLTPWNRVVAEWLSPNDEAEWIHLICGTQIGKTAMQMAWLLYLSKRDASRFMYVNSSDPEARKFIANRLRPFIEGYDKDILGKNSYRTEYLQIGKLSIKVAYGTSEAAIKSDPLPNFIGDETAMWTLADGIELCKKRTRNFPGHKGFLATSPPSSRKHESITQAFSGNVYRWYVPCLQCGGKFPLLLSYLKWEGKKENGEWDNKIVEKTTHVECPFCGEKHFEEDKAEMVNAGEAICVDPDNEYKRRAETKEDTKCLQISSLYSMFTTWAKIAQMFLAAKKIGGSVLGRFMRDEMAEVPEDKQVKQQIEESNIKQFFVRRSESLEDTIKSMSVVTVGIDKQKDSLYIVPVGWRSGAMISGHVLDAHKMMFRTVKTKVDWTPLIEYMAPYQAYTRYCLMDSSAGVDKNIIESMCGYYGPPYHPLKDCYQAAKIAWKNCENGVKRLSIHSDQIKDEIANALELAPADPHAWTFPDNLDDDFYLHMRNEHKVEMKQHGRFVETWQPLYEGIPQHFFSAFVYAVAGMNACRHELQGTAHKAAPRRGRRMLNRRNARR